MLQHKQMYVSWENIIYGVKKIKKWTIPIFCFYSSPIRWGMLHRSILLPFTAEIFLAEGHASRRAKQRPSAVTYSQYSTDSHTLLLTQKQVITDPKLRLVIYIRK